MKGISEDSLRSFFFLIKILLEDQQKNFCITLEELYKAF